MIEIPINDDYMNRAREKASTVGILQGSITGGTSNVVGAIGELVVADSINADENYRGGPDNPLSEEELENKFEVCAENLLIDDQVSKIKQFIWTLDEQKAVDQIIDLTNYS